jgi:hypothetical protein
LRRLAATNFQNVSLLLNKDRPISDGTDKPALHLFPMKDLTGIERFRQIKIRRGDFGKPHCDFSLAIRHVTSISSMSMSMSKKTERMAKQSVFHLCSSVAK